MLCSTELEEIWSSLNYERPPVSNFDDLRRFDRWGLTILHMSNVSWSSARSECRGNIVRGTNSDASRRREPRSEMRLSSANGEGGINIMTGIHLDTTL